MPTRDYTSYTNDQLLSRVDELESQLRAQASIIKNLQKLNPKDPAPKKPRKPRVFDPSRYHTRYIALKIAYLGHAYNGFEHHINNPTRLPTIEEEIWKALVKTKLIFKNEDEGVNWDGCEYSKAGRTDKGVSAFGNVIALRVRSSRPKPRPKPVQETPTEDAEPEETAQSTDAPAETPWDPIYDELSYARLLNRVLPPGIRVLAWCPTLPDGFSARFSCRLRKYRYFFTQPAFCPMPGSRGLSDRPHGPREREGWLNIEAMRDAARRFEGHHDFRNFCKQDPARQITNFERRVDCGAVVEVPGGEIGLPFLGSEELTAVDAKAAGGQPRLYMFEVWGSAFLWHQVRCMVSILFLVGQGLEHPSIVDRLLDAKANPERPIFDMADDHPLVLWDCLFPDLDAGGMEDSLHWVLPDNPVKEGTFSGTGDGRYGAAGINEVVWSIWRRAKMDEIVAGQLMNVVANQRQGSREADSAGPSRREGSTRIFDGSDSAKQKGTYVPILKRERQEAPEVLNARWLARKAAAAEAGADIEMPTVDE